MIILTQGVNKFETLKQANRKLPDFTIASMESQGGKAAQLGDLSMI
jgi:hypothetical protein